MTIFFFVLGLVLLIAGAELLVRGGARLAELIGISPLVIGLTVVAYGTSAPELVVSVIAAYSGQADIAIGNVVGSNIFNVLFILGVAALIMPLVVSQQLVRLDVPLMIGASILTFLLGMDGQLNRTDGMILFVCIVLYTAFLILQSRKETAKERRNHLQGEADQPQATLRTSLSSLLLVAGGLALLVLGARWLVDSSVVIARYFGLSELIIGLTIIAAGTSLPEVATSIIATIRGQRDIAVGNIIGSNIFNLLSVLGMAAIVAPNGIAIANAALRFDIPIMTAVAFACLPIFFTGYRIARWEGALFLAYYVAYTAYLILNANSHASLPLLSAAMIWFAIPLTCITLVVVSLRALREQSRQAKIAIQ